MKTPEQMRDISLGVEERNGPESSRVMYSLAAELAERMDRSERVLGTILGAVVGANEKQEPLLRAMVNGLDEIARRLPEPGYWPKGKIAVKSAPMHVPPNKKDPKTGRVYADFDPKILVTDQALGTLADLDNAPKMEPRPSEGLPYGPGGARSTPTGKPGTILKTRLGHFISDGDCWCHMPGGVSTPATVQRVLAAKPMDHSGDATPYATGYRSPTVTFPGREKPGAPNDGSVHLERDPTRSPTMEGLGEHAPSDATKDSVAECARKDAAILEGMCREFIRYTGLPVDRCMIVREATATGFTWHCEKRPDATAPLEPCMSRANADATIAKLQGLLEESRSRGDKAEESLDSMTDAHAAVVRDLKQKTKQEQSVYAAAIATASDLDRKRKEATRLLRESNTERKCGLASSNLTDEIDEFVGPEPGTPIRHNALYEDGVFGPAHLARARAVLESFKQDVGQYEIQDIDVDEFCHALSAKEGA